MSLRSKERTAWSNMKNRCYNSNYYLFHRYGGRGIVVSDDWKSNYSNFLRDMGRAPTSEHSLDRVDNNKGYFKDNCKWSTPIEQSNNKSTNLILEYNGESKPLSQFCKELNLNYPMVQRRLEMGWHINDAFEKPKGYKRYKYITPEGEFSDQYEVAEKYGIKIKTVSARFCSKTKADWVKIPI